MATLEFDDVTMTYGSGSTARRALLEVSFSLDRSAFAVLSGPSGAGKSTLLKLVLAMERPQSGTIRVAQRDIHRLRNGSIPYLRRNVGAIFQDFKLLQDANPLENVALALQVLGMRGREVRARAAHALEQVEISPTTKRAVRCLSGGEQQRVAIARALAGEPAILLADEPTGNLDPRLTKEILELLAAVRLRGTTVLLATHDPQVMNWADATDFLRLQGGTLMEHRRSLQGGGVRPVETAAEPNEVVRTIEAVA